MVVLTIQDRTHAGREVPAFCESESIEVQKKWRGTTGGFPSGWML